MKKLMKYLFDKNVKFSPFSFVMLFIIFGSNMSPILSIFAITMLVMVDNIIRNLINEDKEEVE